MTVGLKKTRMMAPLECQEVSGYDHSHRNYTGICQTERQIARWKCLNNIALCMHSMLTCDKETTNKHYAFKYINISK